MSDSRWDYDQGRLIALLRRSDGASLSLARTRRARRRVYLGAVLGVILVLGVGYFLVDGRLWPVPDRSGTAVREPAELGLTSRLRPIPPGASVSSAAGGAGTICCAVRDADAKLFLLTSEHAVLPGSPGDPVYQPGRSDGGDESARIGRISRILAAQPGMDTAAAGALIELAPEMGATMTAPGLGSIRGAAAPIVGERIRAVGRTSGLVEGSVMAVNQSVPVRISPTERAGLEGMIRTSPISEQGDSGAPVVNDRGELIGFVYAGSPNYSIVMPISPVLDALGVQLSD